MRERAARVSFGQKWVRESILELIREDLARFRVLLGASLDEDSLDVLARGGLPTLPALRTHNGTVYRWNRACFGVGEGKAHIRIENRVLPSGPTILDEVANAAFFLGMLRGGQEAYGDLAATMPFHDAEANFLAAAQRGLRAQFIWVDGATAPADDLIRRELLPLAWQGLRAAGLDSADVDRYLGVIEQRVASRQNGASWMLRSLADMQGTDTQDALLSALTAATVTRQWEGTPVHEWPLAKVEEGRGGKPHALRIEEFMTTDLITVHPDEPMDLVIRLMDWRRIRHVPVEDEEGKVAGLLSCFEALRQWAPAAPDAGGGPVPVREVMRPDPVTIAPEATVTEAVARMRQAQSDYLLVVKEDRLVGIVTESDILQLTARLLEQLAGESGADGG